MGVSGKPVVDTRHGIQLASLEDLLALKLATITQRAQWKDYFDIAALLRAGLSLADGLAKAQALSLPLLPGKRLSRRNCMTRARMSP